MKFNYKIQLSIFFSFFFIGFYFLLFYNWLLKWCYSYYFNFSYSKFHFLVNMIINSNTIEKDITFKLEQLVINNEVIDYIIITKYIENQLGNYYAFQLCYTLNYILDNINIEIFQY